MRVELRDEIFELEEWKRLSPPERWLYLFLLSEVSGETKIVSFKKIREFTGFKPEIFGVHLSTLVNSNLVNVAPDGALSLPSWEGHTTQDPQARRDAEAVLEVFEFWQQTFRKERTKLSEDRARKIGARLKSFSVEDLKKAILGCAASPFHQGKNEKGITHNGIALIFRNDEKVEQFIGYEKAEEERESEFEELETTLESRAEFYAKLRNGGNG